MIFTIGMSIITNIKLNNTRVNPSIHPSHQLVPLFARSFTMSTLAHSPFLRTTSFSAAAVNRVSGLGTMLAAWRVARRKAREDREMWALAQQDPRLMNDLVCALQRQD